MISSRCGIVDVLLQQVHVFLGSLVLLLKEPFPIVLVPNPVPFPIEVGHVGTKSQLGAARKRFPATYEFVDCSSRLVCRRKLSASRVDVVAFFPPKCGGHVVLAKDREKAFLLFR